MMSDSAVSTVSRKIESHGETNKEHTSVEPRPRKQAINPPHQGHENDAVHLWNVQLKVANNVSFVCSSETMHMLLSLASSALTVHGMWIADS